MEYSIKSYNVDGENIDLDGAESKIVIYENNKVSVAFPVNSAYGIYTIENSTLKINQMEITCRGLLSIGKGPVKYDRARKYSNFENLWSEMISKYPGIMNENIITWTVDFHDQIIILTYER